MEFWNEAMLITVLLKTMLFLNDRVAMRAIKGPSKAEQHSMGQTTGYLPGVMKQIYSYLPSRYWRLGPNVSCDGLGS